MNSHFADAAAGEAPRESTPGVRIGAGSTLAMLVRREFWEHPALWRVPLIVGSHRW